MWTNPPVKLWWHEYVGNKPWVCGILGEDREGLGQHDSNWYNKVIPQLFTQFEYLLTIIMYNQLYTVYR